MVGSLASAVDMYCHPEWVDLLGSIPPRYRLTNKPNIKCNMYGHCQLQTDLNCGLEENGTTRCICLPLTMLTGHRSSKGMTKLDKIFSGKGRITGQYLVYHV